MELVEKYFGDLFHQSGPKNCVPGCPAEIIPWFHPHAVFHSYFIGSKDCSIKARQGLPFFTENYGPKWTEYTTVVHEIAGHHVEVWTCLIVCLLSSYRRLHSHVPPCVRVAHKAFACALHRLLDTPRLSPCACSEPLPFHCTSPRYFWRSSLSFYLGGHVRAVIQQL